MSKLSVLATVSYTVHVVFKDDEVTDEIDQSHDAVKNHILNEYADEADIDILGIEEA